jgi:hypothetical protein
VAFIMLASGDNDQAEPLFQQSLPLFQQAGDTLGEAPAAIALGHLQALRHDDAASQLLQETLARLTVTGHGRVTGAERFEHLVNVALADNFAGQIRLRSGDPDRAAQLMLDGLAAARCAADRFSLLISLYGLALSRQAQGDLPQVSALLTEGLSLADEADDKSSVAYYLEALAEIASRQGHATRAVSLLSAATALLQTSGQGWLQTYVPRAAHGGSALAALRARTGDTAFDHAWARGQAMDGAPVVQDVLAGRAPAMTAPADSAV